MGTGALKDRAEELFRKGRWRKSLKTYEELIVCEPEDARLRVRCGELLRRLGRPLDAARSYCSAGFLYRTQGYRARARAAIQIAVQLAPGEPEIAARLRYMEALLAATPEAPPRDERVPTPAPQPSGSAA